MGPVDSPGFSGEHITYTNKEEVQYGKTTEFRGQSRQSGDDEGVEMSHLRRNLPANPDGVIGTSHKGFLVEI
jgi:hypothetical protein